jgi:ribosome recycling factor
MSIAEQAKEKMLSAIEHFKSELKTLRTGRANPSLLDGVRVEMYGSELRIKELATISIPEPRQILITPFDPQTAGPIAKSIEKANLNLLPVVEKSLIRIHVPPMDEAMRKTIVKQGKQKKETALVAIREVRRKFNEMTRKQKAEGTITEDMLKKEEKAIQEYTDQSCKEIEALFSIKEKEILTL